VEKVTVEELLTKDLKGKVVVFPTDTVYGVGCLVDDLNAIHKIYELKERDYSKPLAILAGSKDISKYVKTITKEAQDLMNKYWPGALTVVMKKSQLIPDLVTSNLDTVGFRMPKSDIALKILNHFGIMATTSINKSGQPPLNDCKLIEENFASKIDYLVIDKEETSNVSSTVLDCTTEVIKVLRQGNIQIK